MGVWFKPRTKSIRRGRSILFASWNAQKVYFFSFCMIPIILVWTHFDSKTAEKLQVQFGRKQAMRQAHFLLLLLFACTSLKRMIDTLIIDTSIMGGGKRKSTCTCNIGTMSVAREHHIDMYVQDRAWKSKLLFHTSSYF